MAYLLPWLFFCGVLLLFFSLLFPSYCYTYLHLSFVETVLSNKELFIEKRGREVCHKFMWRSPSPMRPTQSIMMHLHLTEDRERFFGALAQHCRSPDATNNKRLRKAGAWDEREQVYLAGTVSSSHEITQSSFILYAVLGSVARRTPRPWR
jgi:hypothetical protein